MGLFAPVEKGLKGLFGDGFGMKAARAVAILNGDASGAANAEEAMTQSAAKKKGSAEAQNSALHAYGYFKSLGMDDNAAYTLATNPEKASAFVADRLKSQQYGAGGGSTYDPITGQSRMAPSRHEFQGSVFDVGGGAEGQQAPVTAQHQGTQWITPQPGTTAFGVNSFDGLPRNGAQPTQGAAIFKPGQVVGGFRFKGGDDTDMNNWEKTGGPGPKAPGTFRPF